MDKGSLKTRKPFLSGGGGGVLPNDSTGTAKSGQYSEKEGSSGQFASGGKGGVLANGSSNPAKPA